MLALLMAKTTYPARRDAMMPFKVSSQPAASLLLLLLFPCSGGAGLEQPGHLHSRCQVKGQEQSLE